CSPAVYSPQMRTLVQTSPQRMEFRTSLLGKLFYGWLLIVGASGLAWGVQESEPIPLLTGLLFTTIAACMMYFRMRPIVFDLGMGWYWKGWCRAAAVIDRAPPDRVVRMADLHALQVISRDCRVKSSTVRLYELNIVRQDASRAHVFSCTGGPAIEADIRALAAFLGKPLWRGPS
ncbi:MAG: hypothetical protein PHU21_14515, partial [Elusimicrobia bacterium]|nr:hypothetical protein [Elusimicrobiota bacterium]